MRRWILAVTVCAVLAVGAGSGVQAQAPEGSGRAQAIHRDLDRVLSDPAYRPPSDKKSGISRAGDRLQRRLERSFRSGPQRDSLESPDEGVVTTGAGGQVILAIVLALTIFAIAVAVAYAVSQWMQRGTGTRKEKKKKADADVQIVIDPVAPEPDACLSEANRLAAAGDYAGAQRAIYLALLARLDRAGVLRYDAAMTNGECLRALRPRPDLLAWVRPVANGFDRHHYGFSPATAQDVEAGRASYERVSAMLGAGA